MLLVPFEAQLRGTLPRTFVLPSALGFSLLALEQCPLFRMPIQPTSMGNVTTSFGSAGRWNYSDVVTLPSFCPIGASPVAPKASGWRLDAF